MQLPFLKSVSSAAFSLAMLSLGAFAPSTAHAVSGNTCANTQGVSFSSLSMPTIFVNEGDTLTMFTNSSDRDYYKPQGKRYEFLPNNGTTSYVVEAGVSSVAIENFWGDITVTCTPAALATPSTLSNTASTIGATSQTNATRTGISNNAKGRLNSNATTRNLVTSNAMFFSTQNLPGAAGKFGNPDWSAWVSVEGRSYSGDLEGWSADIVTGVDKLVRDDLIIGALLGYGRVDVKNATQAAEVTSIALGAYFAKRFQNDIFLDGFISIARPDYVVDGASFTSQRSSLALSLSGDFVGGKVKVTPSGKLSTYREKLPAYTGSGGAVAAHSVKNLNLNIGVKIEPLTVMANGILPYISLGADYGSNDSVLSGNQSFFSPRIGAGFGVDLGGGYLSVDVDAGKVQKGVRDVGLRANYEFSF